MKNRRLRPFCLLLVLVMVLLACQVPALAAQTATPPTVKTLRFYNATMDKLPAGQDINNNPIINYHKEKSGINIVVEMLPKENANQKFALILASGDLPDIMEMSSKDLFFKYTQQGTFAPLDELLKNAPNYMAVTTEAMFDFVRYDGKIYAFPYYKGDTGQSYGIFARSDLMEASKIDEVKTLDDFVAALRAIKDATGKIPLTASAFSSGNFDNSLGLLKGSFGVATKLVEKDGKLAFSWIQPEYKDFLTYCKLLYDEGLLDKEFAVNQATQTLEKMVSEAAAITFESWWTAKTIDDNLKQKNPDAKVAYLQLPLGANGQSGVPEPRMINSYMCIAAASKQKEAAIALLDYMSTEEAYFVQNYGIEGIFHTVENGQIVSTPEQAALLDYAVVYQLSDKYENFRIRLSRKGFIPYYDQTFIYPRVYDVSHYMPPIELYDSKYSELSTFAFESAVQFIMGAKSLNDFDQYVNDFNQRGGSAVIDSVNAWYAQR